MTFSTLLTACSDPTIGQQRGGQRDTIAAESGESDQAVMAIAESAWDYIVENSPFYRLQLNLPVVKFRDISEQRHNENVAFAKGILERLSAIDPSALSEDARTTYDILEFQYQSTLDTADFYWLKFEMSPYRGPYYFNFARQALGIQPLADEAGRTAYLALLQEYAGLARQLSAKVQGQRERGILLPKPTLAPTRATFEHLMAEAPAALAVQAERLAGLDEVEASAFQAQVTAAIDDKVLPAFADLLAAIGEDYETAAPDSVGLYQYPGGKQYYRQLIGVYTTLDLSPEAIHETGLQAVAETEAAMKAIRDELGWIGTREEFHHTLRTDPRFLASTPQEVEERFTHHIRRIEPKLDQYFEVMPRATYGVKRLSPAAEAGMTYGFYSPPSAAQKDGLYYYNASNLGQKSMITYNALIYHELLPGHHFHLATQSENTAQPMFRRKYMVGAFTEGWAEYAASLGFEMGLYDDPYDRYGVYIGQIFLASRLVVDTGMNYLGWSLEEGRKYMLAHVFQTEAEIQSETLRYSTGIPGQALCYRLGFEKIWELRRKAEAALGEQFDIREFHSEILNDGSKPLAVLEAKIDRFIDRTRFGE